MKNPDFSQIAEGNNVPKIDKFLVLHGIFIVSSKLTISCPPGFFADA